MRYSVRVENASGFFAHADVPATEGVSAVDWALGEAMKGGLDPYKEPHTITLTARPEGEVVPQTQDDDEEPAISLLDLAEYQTVSLRMDGIPAELLDQLLKVIEKASLQTFGPVVIDTHFDQQAWRDAHPAT